MKKKKKKMSMKKPQIKYSTMLENRMNHALSDLPPTNFSVHPRHFEQNKLWLKIHLYNAAAAAAAASVVKSWLPAPTRRCGAPRQLPQLRCVVVSVPAPPQIQSPTPRTRNHFLGDSDSILDALESCEEVSYCCLLERSTTRKKKKLEPQANEEDDLGPKLRSYSVGLGPNSPCSGLTVNYVVLRSYSSYRRGGPPLWSYKYVSVRYECAVSDPFDARRRPMESADGAIRCGDKYYAVSLQGEVAEMEVIDTRLRITAVGSMRAVPSSRSSSRFFKECVMGVEGEILLVYLIHHESVEVVDDVEVFRLDSDRLDLIKVERMQGRTMFLKESRWEWVESAEFGCRDNCVFFTEGKEKKWRVYDFKTCCISSL